MTIYLGTSGKIELARQGSGDPLYSTLEPADVNVAARRFSVNFASAALVTGDKIVIARTDPTQKLELVAGHNHEDWSGYVNKDPLGGMRLYNNYSDALEGGKQNAVELTAPSGRQEIKISTGETRDRCLAQVQNFEITTTRETIDITTLSQQFRNQYTNGLISGQGQVNCFWEHTLGTCESALGEPLGNIEFSAYLAHLCIRVQQGAAFQGKFYIYDGGVDEASVWYQAECIVTNVSVNVEPTQIIQSSISFVTTGPITLKTGYEPALLLQEDRFLVLQEDGESGIIVSPNDR